MRPVKRGVEIAWVPRFAPYPAVVDRLLRTMRRSACLAGMRVERETLHAGIYERDTVLAWVRAHAMTEHMTQAAVVEAFDAQRSTADLVAVVVMADLT